MIAAVTSDEGLTGGQGVARGSSNNRTRGKAMRQVPVSFQEELLIGTRPLDDSISALIGVPKEAPRPICHQRRQEQETRF
jgi:hypothetical protein